MASQPLIEGAELCILTAVSLLAFLGLQYPIAMLPILVFECSVALPEPRSTAGRSTRDPCHQLPAEDQSQAKGSKLAAENAGLRGSVLR